jgi:hypothetical protein
MFSPSLQSLVVQAHIEELHKVAQAYNRDRAFAAWSHEVDRPRAAHLSAAAKRALSRVLGGTRGASVANHGLELVGGSSATTPRPRGHLS